MIRSLPIINLSSSPFVLGWIAFGRSGSGGSIGGKTIGRGLVGEGVSGRRMGELPRGPDVARNDLAWGSWFLPRIVKTCPARSSDFLGRVVDRGIALRGSQRRPLKKLILPT